MSFTIFDLWLIVIVLIFTIYGSRTNALNQITGIVSMFISALVTKLFFYKLSVSVGGQFQEQKDTDLVVYLISFIVIYVLTLILLRILVYYKELQIEGLPDQIIAILLGVVRNLLRISFLIMILINCIIEVFGFHLRIFFAFDESPKRFSISLGL